VNLGQALASLSVLGVLPSAAVVGEPPRPALRFERAASLSCLEEARRVMEASGDVYAAMDAWLHDRRGTSVDDLRAQLHLAPPQATDPFAAFEGEWVGTWNELPTRHLWLTTGEGEQLVWVVDGARRKPAINLVAADGTMCGIVDDGGQERLHMGRPFGDTGIIWATPNRRYVERVVHRDGHGDEREGDVVIYEIRETILSDQGERPGVTARYRRVDPLPALS
jgi:hypothetical protein